MKHVFQGLKIGFGCLILGMLLLHELFAQIAHEIIPQEYDSMATYHHKAPWLSYNLRHINFQDMPDTISFELENPFFDDFSQGGLHPDSTKWWITDGTSRFPLKSYHMAINPPSWGVLTFDGLNANGLPYNTQILESGQTDELRSHFIDLSAYGPNDNIALSFFLQPQGTGNAPEPEDVFKVLFTIAGQSLDSLIEVANIPGEMVHPFRQYIILLENPAFFHSQFQLVFQSVGSRNGLLDQWHLDYVYLGANRYLGDTTYNDLAIINTHLNFLSPYSAYPAAIYPPASAQNNLEVEVKNLNDTVQNANLEGTIIEPNANSIRFEQSFNLKPLNEEVRKAELNGALISPPNTPGNITITTRLLVDDDIPCNDELIQQIPIDSLMAYDDGEADASYGITQPKGFGVRFTLPESNTYEISAVWISFVPLFNPSQVGNIINYMDGKGFRLVVWKAADPDSILISQIGTAKVIYGDSLNHFQRFELDQPVVLPDTFWVGIKQADGLPVGVGYDRTTTRHFTYWDSAGVWTLSRLGGSPMIRPEIRIPETSTAIASILNTSDLSLSISPQPSEHKLVSVHLGEALNSSEISIFDIQGRLVTKYQYGGSSLSEIQIHIPEINSGLYWLKVKGTDKRGKMRYGTIKLMKR